jgi:putative transposase
MTRLINTYRGRFGVEPVCRVLDFNPSTYWARLTRPPSKRQLRDESLNIEIKRVFDENYGVYGVPKVYKQLNREGIRVAKCTVERLMRLLGLRGARRGKKRITTTPDETASRPADLVDRQFVATRPNQLWVADMTYVRTWAGFSYVALVIDVFSRYIVGWALATHLKTELPLEALEMAIWRRDTVLEGLVHHSDRGSQYTSIRYTERLDEAGIAPSVGSRGDSYDNALAEATIGLYKTELVKRKGPWRTPEQLELATLEWIDWWNHRRLHEAIGHVPPAEKEAMYYTEKQPEKETEKTLEIVGKKPL